MKLLVMVLDAEPVTLSVDGIRSQAVDEYDLSHGVHIFPDVVIDAATRTTHNERNNDRAPVLLLLHPFTGKLLSTTGLFSTTTSVSQHRKGGTTLDFNEARDDGWQWHQLDHMQIIST